MLEFLRKFQNRAIKIVWVNSIANTKSINLQLFTFILYGVEGPLWSMEIFRAQSIYREVYSYGFLERAALVHLMLGALLTYGKVS